MPNSHIEGQLNEAERRLLTEAITQAREKPEIVIEVGTWLGGGSTLHILRALEKNGQGHLWGIEADRSIYERMLANIRAATPEACQRFTPLFGFSQDVIPHWLSEQASGMAVDFAFLDGGNNPGEQIEEFQLLDPRIPVGGQLMAHDAKMRKGKWLVPYLSRLDNWQLFKMRCNPVEIFAAVLPASVCSFILGLMPARLSRRLSDGCK
jgi:predicted O-methyltransferase YrrM